MSFNLLLYAEFLCGWLFCAVSCFFCFHFTGCMFLQQCITCCVVSVELRVGCMFQKQRIACHVVDSVKIFRLCRINECRLIWFLYVQLRKLAVVLFELINWMEKLIGSWDWQFRQRKDYQLIRLIRSLSCVQNTEFNKVNHCLKLPCIQQLERRWWDIKIFVAFCDLTINSGN